MGIELALVHDPSEDLCCSLQVQESRWNVTFSSDFATVNYSYLNFQTFVPEQSCSGCSLDNDYLVTINRQCTAFLLVCCGTPVAAEAFCPAFASGNLHGVGEYEWELEKCLQNFGCCRGYLAFLSSPAIDYNDAFAFIPAVPVAMRQIVAGIEAALITVSTSLFHTKQRNAVYFSLCC